MLKTVKIQHEKWMGIGVNAEDEQTPYPYCKHSKLKEKGQRFKVYRCFMAQFGTYRLNNPFQSIPIDMSI